MSPQTYYSLQLQSQLDCANSSTISFSDLSGLLEQTFVTFLTKVHKLEKKTEKRGQNVCYTNGEADRWMWFYADDCLKSPKGEAKRNCIFYELFLSRYSFFTFFVKLVLVYSTLQFAKQAKNIKKKYIYFSAACCSPVQDDQGLENPVLNYQTNNNKKSVYLFSRSHVELIRTSLIWHFTNLTDFPVSKLRRKVFRSLESAVFVLKNSEKAWKILTCVWESFSRTKFIYVVIRQDWPLWPSQWPHSLLAWHDWCRLS